MKKVRNNAYKFSTSLRLKVSILFYRYEEIHGTLRSITDTIDIEKAIQANSSPTINKFHRHIVKIIEFLLLTFATVLQLKITTVYLNINTVNSQFNIYWEGYYGAYSTLSTNSVSILSLLKLSILTCNNVNF